MDSHSLYDAFYDLVMHQPTNTVNNVKGKVNTRSSVSIKAAATAFIVDDDDAVRESLSLLLESAGIASETYDSAQAFLDAYQPQRRGCLIVDVRMPGMSGLELQAELTTRNINIPVILLTGYADVALAIRAFKSGARDLIEKPFDSQVFVKRVRETLAEEAKTDDNGENPDQNGQDMHPGRKYAHQILASIGDGVITTDAEGAIEYLNPIAEHLTGWESQEAKGKPLEQILFLIDEISRQPIQALQQPLNRIPMAGVEGETATILVQRNGREFPIDRSVAPILNDANETLGYVIVFHDATRARTAARQLSYFATHDPLTGLVNRREFERRLERALSSAWENNTQHALCYLDLDRFKIVNDSAGHAAGDQLLRQISMLLRQKLRQRDTLARIGGDEFAVLLEHCPLGHARSIADTLREAVQDFRFANSGKIFAVGASIGVTSISAENKSLNDVMQAADMACFRAKANGRNRIQIHDSTDHAEIEQYRHANWFSYLDEALRKNYIQLYSQAIVPLNAQSEKEHYEILARLVDSTGKLLPAAAFVPTAERTELGPSLDRWVISTALKRLADSPHQLTRLGLCAVNLTSHTLNDQQAVDNQAFLSFLTEQLAETGVPATKLCFEISELAITSNLPQAIALMEALKNAGCRVAIDDFASTPPGFAYLKHLSVDFLKIDGYLIKDIITSPVSLVTVKSIADIAQVMGIRTVAKCVENRDIWDTLRNTEIDLVQGFHVAKPVRFGNYY